MPATSELIRAAATTGAQSSLLGRSLALRDFRATAVGNICAYDPYVLAGVELEPQHLALRGIVCPGGGGFTTDGGVSLAWRPTMRVVIIEGAVGGGLFLTPPVLVTKLDRPVSRRSTARDSARTPADVVRWIKEVTDLPKDRIGRLLGVSRMAVHLWEHEGAISDDKRRRMLAVRDVLLRAARQHRTPQELAMWLDAPQGHDGRTVAQLIEAGELARARYLAAASPSPLAVPPPPWASRPVPEPFKVGAERLPRAAPPDDDALAALRAEAELDDDTETA